MAINKELTEADLHRLWQRGSLSKGELLTLDGQAVEIIYSGVWNRDAGPDFRNAILRLAGEMVKGDVEIHLEPDMWYSHMHHVDPAYNGVVLHLALGGGAGRPIVREDGVKVPQVLLPPTVIDTLAPSSRPSGVERLVVQSCPLRQREKRFVHETVLAAAEERLMDKAARFAEQLGDASWDQIVYRGICEALGYAVNQIPFRKLADCVPVDLIMTEMRWAKEHEVRDRIWALLFGTAGLLPSQARPTVTLVDAELREFIQPLEQHWQEISHRRKIEPMRPEEWQFFRLRPANFPTRRVAALGLLLPRFARGGFLGRFLQIFESLAEQPKRLARELERLFVVPAEGVWVRASRLDRDPDLRGRGAPSSLLGSARAREIVTNVVLPIMYLYGVDSGDGRLPSLARETYSLVPKLSDNLITRAMVMQLGDVLPGGRKPASAAEQQGLVQLHKLYCQPLRCEACQRLGSLSGRLTLRLRDKIEALRRKKS
jgi:hypothetical protein